jgi:putative hydrolase of HD superfamily
MDKTRHDSAATSLFDFSVLAERLKTELRHSWLSSRRRESVAEHTWLMALMALLCHSRPEVSVRLDGSLR